MKKSILTIAMILGIVLPTIKVNATEYYRNDNGVLLTESEYQTISAFYYDGYQDVLTQDEYNYLKEKEVFNNKVESVISEAPKASIIDGNRTLKLSKTCNTTTCMISSTVTWSTFPTIRSYDVIGARLYNVTRSGMPTTSVITNLGTTNSTERKLFNNGFGVSVQIPPLFTSLKIVQTFEVTKGGTVYATYQHASGAISLANSKNYTIGITGFGGVFLFSGVAANIYDNGPGLSIAV